MAIKLGLEQIQNYYYSLDISKLPFDIIKILYEKGVLPAYNLQNHIMKTFKEEELYEINDVLGIEEETIFNFIMNQFTKKENSKSVKLDSNIKKLLKLKKIWNEDFSYSSIHDEYNKLNQISPNLYTCMLNVGEDKLTLENIIKLIGTSKAFDTLVEYVLYLDNTSLIQKLIPKDDLYVKLKYYYKLDKESSPYICEFFEHIDKERQTDKIKTNKIIKNNDFHINAIIDGELSIDYVRTENIFGMTPDDNIIAKMLLLYNKVFNKKKAMNDKDIHTLKNMRKSINNIRRSNEYKVVDKDYFEYQLPKNGVLTLK